MASPAGVVPRQRLAQDLASSRQISTGLLERRVRPLSTFCNLQTFSVNRLKEYKKERKKWVQDKTSDSIEHYMINNFEALILSFLYKNCQESGSNNVMEHPDFVLQQINLFNDRTYINDDLQPVLYRYFTTTLYVCIAYILGLTKEIDNSKIVADFFLSHTKAH